MSFQIENGKLIRYIVDSEETEVLIPGGITEIGEEAFAECDTLKGIAIPAGVTKIGKRAFYCCTELAEIDLPEGMAEIEESAFELCRRLMKITVPGSLESIGEDAFNLCADEEDVPAFYLPHLDYYRKNSRKLYDCRHFAYINGERLEEYTYPEGTKEIAEEDFRNCASLRRVIIPEGVTAIGRSAFENCSNLEYVTLPSTLEEVGARVFYFSLHDKDVHVTGLDHFLKLNAGCLPELWNYDLWINGKPVEQLRLPEVIRKIGDHFLKGCCSLTELTIPEGVEEIGEHAFDSCRNLRGVKFPSTLHYIGESAFENCSSLKNLSIRGSGLSIGPCAFQSCDELESVVLEEGVREIGDEAFCMCPALTGVTFPSSIEKLGDGLFILDRFSAESVTVNVTVPDMCTYFRLPITAPHYLYCAGEPVEDFAFPSGMTRIENHAFSCCLSLKRVTIPAGVREIGMSAFAHCRNLEEVNISEGVRIIRDSAFLRCVSLREVILPESVRSICARAFGVCEHLKTIIVKGKHVRIADGAFADNGYEVFTAPEDAILGSKRACMWGIGLKFYPAESLLMHLANCPQRMLGRAEEKILESGNQDLIQAYQKQKAEGTFDHNPGARDALSSNRYTDEELVMFAQQDESW